VSPTEGVYVAATKASPSTDEPVKRTATKAPAKAGAKRSAARSSSSSVATKRAAKSTTRASKTTQRAAKTAGAKRSEPTKAQPTKKDRAPAKGAAAKPSRSRAKKAAAPKDVEVVADTLDPEVEDLDVEPDLDGEPDADIEPEDIDIEAADLNLDDLEDVAPEGEDVDLDQAATDDVDATAPALAVDDTVEDDEEIAEPSEKDKASGDFVWDEDESEALRQARKDAELTASADSVRAYLKKRSSWPSGSRPACTLASCWPRWPSAVRSCRPLSAAT
jgi:RNA polymerase primary sigma factor